MHLCYIDESGTSDIPGNTSHFILAGLSIPIEKWRYCDTKIRLLKDRYNLGEGEIHVAWILRRYLEQSTIPSFGSLSFVERRSEVLRYRRTELYRLQRTNRNAYRQTRKNYKKTEAYIHLSEEERRQMIIELATIVSKWRFARLFSECVDKVFFDPTLARDSIDEQSLEQIVSRFEQFLKMCSIKNPSKAYGLLIHDNNETIATKHTRLMKKFHNRGTLWTSINHIIETPLFVDSQLTSMVQIADLCAYAVRRYLENDESELFDLIFQRADRKKGIVVGVRHFSVDDCKCKICISHRQ
jgi:Protein of unknown function (DUF3800)